MASEENVTCLKYSRFGNPLEVLEIHEEEMYGVGSTEVLVKIVAASINPDDIKTIQGENSVELTFPVIGGTEWVGIVIKVGSFVKGLSCGDRVVPLMSELGAWRTHVKIKEKDVLKIPSKIGNRQGGRATFIVNICTAYRILKDFVSLRPGDIVIQNGANSDVGQAVHQLCKMWNIKSVGIVSNRPDIEDLRKYLKDLGANAVLTVEELKTSDIFVLAKPKLGLDCIGGKSAEEVARHLENKGVLVTYGNISGEPIKISKRELIDRNLKFVGFSMAQWVNDNINSTEKTTMFDALCGMMKEGLYKYPVCERVPLKQYKKYMQAAIDFKGFNNKKFLLDCSDFFFSWFN